jgi:hypothetical protein
MLTTEALVAELPEKEKPGPGGMGGMDYEAAPFQAESETLSRFSGPECK